jgi:hypothetical protein
MMEIHQIGDLTLAGNFTFPTTSTGEVGKVGKQALNQHPHHHLSRGCGGVVGVARGVDFTGGENRLGAGGWPAPLPAGSMSLRFA